MQWICKSLQPFHLALLQTPNLWTNNWFNSANLPANQYILILRNRPTPFFRTKALFLPSRFWQSTVPRASSSLGAGKQSRSCVCTRTESWSIAVWKVTPNHQQAKQTTASHSHVELKSDGISSHLFLENICGLSYWSNDYNGSMQQAFYSVTWSYANESKSKMMVKKFSFLPLLKQMKLSWTFWIPIKK